MDWSYNWIYNVFNQLFELSFWRHPFTSEDPLVSKWCNAKFSKICSNQETILDALKVSMFTAIMTFLGELFF